MRAFARIALILVVLQVTRPTWASQIEGRFYPEKQRYLVGEPIFIVLDLTNPGPHPVWISDSSCVWLDTRFEAPTASRPHSRVSLFGCSGGIAGSCASSSMGIRPGEHFRRRYLLDGHFLLDTPGVYPIYAWHKVDFCAGKEDYRIVATQEVAAHFDLTLVDGSEEELAAAYAPILRDLYSPDSMTSWLARSALVQNPPPFLESVILRMADDSQTVTYSISGLRQLATPRAKARLAKLSAAGNPEGIRQMAIEALGGLGDSTYCTDMLDIARKRGEYSQFIALRAAGYLCGEEALPFLTALLAQPEYSTRFEAVYALGNTHCRDAVPLLIPMLVDPDPNVRRAARDALAALTHRRSKNSEEAPQAIQRDWATWWRSHSTTAPIYGIDDCKNPEPLR